MPSRSILNISIEFSGNRYLMLQEIAGNDSDASIKYFITLNPVTPAVHMSQFVVVKPT